MGSDECINQKLEACRVVEQQISKVPFCIIAITGKMGVGKTSLSRYLSYKLRISHLETDLFLRLIDSKVRYDYKYIHEVLESKKRDKRHIIVEGCSVLPIIRKFEPNEVFLIHIENSFSERPPHELIELENTEKCSIREIINVDLNPDCPSDLKAIKNHAICW
ncbi:MAG: hypothetical protein HY306_01820 [Nitrosomonadales bacterium]|nr:hypothetical protein [Nitrosomonadales bacterium]